MQDNEVLAEPLVGYEPDISHIITEDDEPVDNLFSEYKRLFEKSFFRQASK